MNIKEAIVYLKRFKYRAVDLIHLEDAVDVAVEHLEKCQKNEDGIYEHRSEIEELPKIKGWVARDENYELHFFTNVPSRYFTSKRWYADEGLHVPLECTLYSDVDWDSEPVEVELLIRRIEK